MFRIFDTVMSSGGLNVRGLNAGWRLGAPERHR